MVNFEISTIEISGFMSVFMALRLPFGKECRSEIFANYTGWVNETEIKNVYTEYGITIHEKDIALLSNLVKSGDEHAKVVRGLIVYAEINAPRYMWQEIDTTGLVQNAFQVKVQCTYKVKDFPQKNS